MRRFVVDTAVFVYALGGAHPYRSPCRQIVARQSASQLRGEASAALIQELVRQRHRQLGDRRAAADSAQDVARILTLHALDPADVPLSLELYARHPRLDAIDATFAAVALNRGIDTILSPDHGFDGIEGLARVDPLDGTAVAALG